MKNLTNKILVIAVLLGAVAYFGKNIYRNWTQRSHYYARLRFDAHDVLIEIQQLQAKYHQKKNVYADSIAELLKEFPTASRYLKKNPTHYTGKAKGNSYSGSSYFYSIEEANADDFVAQARHRGFVFVGEDIWQIQKEGKPTAIVTSKYYKKKREK
ncbi:hypothetical protein [Bacteriovorax sp. DB6_IX]|uniref:hypothetical protein n=1 Tax=Bacteriovorax sp. DB6_IX TaxID=1353530 RepID=UPI00038A20AC|nr:hypothetical protein [Bacteriovorax sp. DB6_IX]EQC51696.1 hypothetical protein M901_0288 [Bacteriovorax sp. DB6_IX]